jgi:small redox-active disulfide protein 2
MHIQVLGPGCRACREAERIIREAITECGAEVFLERIDDLQEIARLGVLTTPTVLVDGVVKCVGKVPRKKEVWAWLTAAS